jgi:hypothetical protein
MHAYAYTNVITHQTKLYVTVAFTFCTAQSMHGGTALLSLSLFPFSCYPWLPAKLLLHDFYQRSAAAAEQTTTTTSGALF